MRSLTNTSQVEQLVNGDNELLKTLYGNILPKVIVYVKKNNGTADDGEEVFQRALFEIIVRAKVSGIQIKTSFEGYVFTVCKNLWLQELNAKKKRVRKDRIFEHLVEEDKTIISIIEQERWDLFEEKLKLLTDNCRALLKDFFEKVPYKAIVKKFNYSCENVAFQRVFKCKKRLGDLIKADSRYKDLF